MPLSRTETLSFTTAPSLFARLGKAAVLAVARRRDRRALARLDQHLLRDIGLSRDEARTEAAKPFWQP
ncbi:MAG: DUF1127 domain-containing protein [Paracoccaceae bacterium]|nr:DUF1127 domain-containing protein [Paracoccaceae bacterium]